MRFNIMLTGFLTLEKYSFDMELSLLGWGLSYRRKPEKGLTLMASLGPLHVSIFDNEKQNEWFSKLVEKGENSDGSLKAQPFGLTINDKDEDYV